MKIKNFQIKDCRDCFWYQTEAKSLQKEFCPWHRDSEDQPRGIVKQIKQTKKELKKWRIILGILTLISLTGLILALVWQSPLLGVKSVANLPLLIWAISKHEREIKQELKELTKKKSEWIIEYD